MIRILVILLCAQSISFGATIYCNPSGGGSGADFNNLATLPSTTGFVRGNTYVMVEGTYSGRTFSTTESGTALITIRKASTADSAVEGYATTLFDGAATFSGGLTFATAYWTLDGVTGSEDSGHGIHVSMNAQDSALSVQNSNITIERVKVSWPDKEDLDHVPSVAGENLFWTGSGYRALSDITYRRCFFQEVPGCPWRFINADNILVENCWVDGNNSTPEEHAALFVFRSSCNNGIIRNNYFKRVEGTGGVFFYDDAHSNFDVYGNVFRATSFGNGHIGVNVHVDTPDAAVNNVRYYNNTHDNLGTGGNGGAYPLVGTGNSLRNNIWYRFTELAGISGDYNYHSDCDFGFGYTPASNDSTVFEDGSGKHSTITSSPFVDAANEDYRLASAIAGLDTDVGETDADGNTRGQDGVFDRGAFEYDSGGGGGTSGGGSSDQRVTINGNVTFNGNVTK
jgi:hypothetical protein